MYTYVHGPVCKKENTATYVQTGGVSHAYSRIYTYGQGSCTWLGQNGETMSSSCSWGANRLGRNGMRHRVHRDGLDGIGDGKQGLAYRRTEETALCSTGHVRNGILFIRRGLAYRKTRKWTSYGQNGGPVNREGCGVPQNG